MTPEQIESIRAMDHVQFLYFILISAAFLACSVVSVWFITYFKKDAELKAIKDSLNIVTKQIEDVKNLSSMIANNKTYLHQKRIDVIIEFSNWLRDLSRMIESHDSFRPGEAEKLVKAIENIQTHSGTIDLFVPSNNLQGHLDSINIIIRETTEIVSSIVFDESVKQKEVAQKMLDVKMAPVIERFKIAHEGVLDELRSMLNIEYHSHANKNIYE